MIVLIVIFLKSLLGIHRAWKDEFVRMLGPCPGNLSSNPYSMFEMDLFVLSLIVA